VPTGKAVSYKEEFALHLDKMRNNKGYSFLGDHLTMIFHKKECPHLKKATKASLIGLGSHPKSHWKPCPKCNPQKTSMKKKSRKPMQQSRLDQIWAACEKYISKTELLGNQLRSLCADKGIFAEITGELIKMTTISGEWHFNFVVRPIELYHRNYNGEDGFHIQAKSFPTPIHVIAYVQKHDIKDMKRKLLISIEREITKEIEKVSWPPYTDQYLM